MMKQTSQNGKNVKFEEFVITNTSKAFETKCNIFLFFFLVIGSKFESIKYFS